MMYLKFVRAHPLKVITAWILAAQVWGLEARMLLSSPSMNSQQLGHLYPYAVVMAVLPTLLSAFLLRLKLPLWFVLVSLVLLAAGPFGWSISHAYPETPRQAIDLACVIGLWSTYSVTAGVLSFRK